MVTLKRRMKSVRSTRQITKAMELISASKMRRSAEATLASRYYAEVALQILTDLSHIIDVRAHPLYAVRSVKTRLYIVITSNRGLAGSYNKNVLQLFASHLKEDEKSGVKSKAILIGRQAGHFGTTVRGLEVVGLYEQLPEKPTTAELSPITTTAKQLFTGRTPAVDAVELVYTRYGSSVLQTASRQPLLPAGFVDGPDSTTPKDSLFEPSKSEVLGVVTERLIDIQLLQAYLESQASEQSARMVAMKTASDNARDLIDDLTLTSNTLRQATITGELAEITAGAEVIL